MQGQGRVRKGAAGAHFGGDPDGLHDLLRIRTFPAGQLGVPLDAIGALRDVRNRNGDELFGLAIERTVCEHRAAKLLERSMCRRRKFPAAGGQGGCGCVVQGLGHRGPPVGIATWTMVGNADCVCPIVTLDRRGCRDTRQSSRGHLDCR